MSRLIIKTTISCIIWTIIFTFEELWLWKGRPWSFRIIRGNHLSWYRWFDVLIIGKALGKRFCIHKVRIELTFLSHIGVVFLESSFISISYLIPWFWIQLDCILKIWIIIILIIRSLGILIFSLSFIRSYICDVRS